MVLVLVDIVDYWEVHGWLFLLGLATFPRITLLFFSSLPFTPLIILGWLLAPHLVGSVD